jgi:hypothetical protein
VGNIRQEPRERYKTAKVFGFELPAGILVRADDVIA